MKLGVNIDHVATLREARYRTQCNVVGWAEPSVLDAAKVVEESGAHGITIHLREDRRHIQDSDVYAIRKQCDLPLNLEMAASREILSIALKVVPAEVCLVPERRQEVTTEGGLDVLKARRRISDFVKALQRKKIVVSLFIAPDLRQIRAAAESGAEFIELHTGPYAEARTMASQRVQIKRLKEGLALARSLGLRVNAGHGLRTSNLAPILELSDVETLNIGHSIVSRALAVGLESSIKEMLAAINSKGQKKEDWR